MDVDEWGQVVLMKLLLRYARTMLARPVWREGERKDGVEESEEIEMDKDLELLLESVKPVFQSRNPAVSNDTFLRIFFSVDEWFQGRGCCDESYVLWRTTFLLDIFCASLVEIAVFLSRS